MWVQKIACSEGIITSIHKSYQKTAFDWWVCCPSRDTYIVWDTYNNTYKTRKFHYFCLKYVDSRLCGVLEWCWLPVQPSLLRRCSLCTILQQKALKLIMWSWLYNTISSDLYVLGDALFCEYTIIVSFNQIINCNVILMYEVLYYNYFTELLDQSNAVVF